MQTFHPELPSCLVCGKASWEVALHDTLFSQTAPSALGPQKTLFFESSSDFLAHDSKTQQTVDCKKVKKKLLSFSHTEIS